MSRSGIVAILLLFLLTTPTRAQESVPVLVSPVSEVLVALERRAPADLRSLNRSTLAAEVAGVVTAVHADVGQTTATGSTLLEIDPTDYELVLSRAEADLASARAQLAEAQARLRRAEELGRNQYLSPEEQLSRETDVAVSNARIQSAEVAVAAAQRDLDRTRILAPFPAAIDERHAQLGSYVTPGQPLFEITETDRFEVDAELPAHIAESIDSAETIWFESRHRRWPASLIRRSPVIDPSRRATRARFALVGDAPPIGSSGEIVWSVGDGMLPADLLVRRNGQMGVFLHRDGRAEFHPIASAQEGRPVPMDAPGTPSMNAEIVVQGRTRLQDGTPVSVSRQP